MSSHRGSPGAADWACSGAGCVVGVEAFPESLAAAGVRAPYGLGVGSPGSPAPWPACVCGQVWFLGRLAATTAMVVPPCWCGDGSPVLHVLWLRRLVGAGEVTRPTGSGSLGFPASLVRDRVCRSLTRGCLPIRYDAKCGKPRVCPYTHSSMLAATHHRSKT